MARTTATASEWVLPLAPARTTFIFRASLVQTAYGRPSGKESGSCSCRPCRRGPGPRRDCEQPRRNDPSEEPTHEHHPAQQCQQHRHPSHRLQPQTSNEVIADNVKLLIEQLEAGHSEGLTTYLSAMGKFHHYSLGNILEIARHKPDATHVADLYAWNQLGRKVMKGQRASASLLRLYSGQPLLRSPKLLAARFGADKGAADWRRFGRMPGFINRKPKHQDVKGRYPFARLVACSGDMFLQAEACYTNLIALFERQEAEQRESRSRYVVHSILPSAFLTLARFRNALRHTGRSAAADMAFAIAAYAHVWSDRTLRRSLPRTISHATQAGDDGTCTFEEHSPKPGYGSARAERTVSK